MVVVFGSADILSDSEGKEEWTSGDGESKFRLNHGTQTVEIGK